MHYLHFEEYSNRIDSLVNCIETEGREFKPRVVVVVFLTLFMYLYIIIVDIYLLNNAKFDSRYDTRYFQSLVK
jgi:hypothetical protein